MLNVMFCREQYEGCFSEALLRCIWSNVQDYEFFLINDDFLIKIELIHTTLILST